MKDANRQRGYVAVELALGISLLVLPVAALVVTLPGWAERQSVARVIAREVARTTAVGGTCEPWESTALAVQLARNLGFGPADVSVTLDCVPGARLTRGGTVTARATVAMPAVAVPLLGAVGAWHWTAANVQPVDPYRSFP